MSKQMDRILFGISLLTVLLLVGCKESADTAPIDRTETTSLAPFFLSLEEVAEWSGSGSMADPDNVSSVPLATRFIDPGSQLDPSLPSNAKVLIAPDGMGNYANFLEEQAKFNHYTFTQWAFIDSINWFGVSAGSNIGIPSRPWVEAAHRNGVKVLGTVFFAPRAYGGNEVGPTTLLRRDADGRFLYARKLVEIAEYYGFDGWLMNQETDLSDASPEVSEGYLAFMAELTALRPAGMEIHWYDSMLPSGEVAWQNELNERNAPFLQNGQHRTADAMFVNYWWNRERVETSLDTAAAISRSPFDVYTGADLWPGRPAQGVSRAPGWLQVLDGDDGGPVTSIAMFADNYTFLFTGYEDLPAASMFATDEADVSAFYSSANRLYGGDDGNPAIRDPEGNWPGIGSRIPARSTLNQLPFSTNFSTGHGRLKARQGVLTAQPWHDMAAQDMLPSWQFAVQGDRAAIAATKVDFDFERAYEKGNSIRVAADPTTGRASIPLYKTAFDTNLPLTVEVVYALTTDYAGASLWLETARGHKYRRMLEPTTGEWRRSLLSVEGGDSDKIIRIGIDLAPGVGAPATLHLGELLLRRSDKS